MAVPKEYVLKSWFPIRRRVVCGGFSRLIEADRQIATVFAGEVRDNPNHKTGQAHQDTNLIISPPPNSKKIKTRKKYVDQKPSKMPMLDFFCIKFEISVKFHIG